MLEPFPTRNWLKVVSRGGHRDAIPESRESGENKRRHTMWKFFFHLVLPPEELQSPYPDIFERHFSPMVLKQDRAVRGFAIIWIVFKVTSPQQHVHFIGAHAILKHFVSIQPVLHIISFDNNHRKVQFPDRVNYLFRRVMRSCKEPANLLCSLPLKLILSAICISKLSSRL